MSALEDVYKYAEYIMAYKNFECDKNAFVEGIKKLLPKKKNLICDYFKS